MGLRERLLGKRAASVAASDEDIFDEAFLARLELLQVIARRLFRGRQRAERKTRKVGSGLEFADHRDYSPGDDIRYLDWTVWIRLRHALIRLFEEDEDLPIRLVVDVSDSMSTRGGAKLRYARQVAAALAYVGLANLDRVGLTCMSGRTHVTLPAVRGKGRIFRVFEFLRTAEAGGPTDIRQGCSRVAAEATQPGLTVVLSDFYDLEGAFDGLNMLRFRKHEPVAIQVIDPAEADPTGSGLRGDVTLVDCEGGARRDVTLSPRALRDYAEAHERFCSHLEASCRSRGIHYVRADIDVPFDDLVLRMFRLGGDPAVTFAGWTLPQLGMLAALAGGAITGLYLLRMRRRQVVVPFAALWEQVSRESESRQLWRRLRRLFSWLVQMLILLALLAALGDPRPDVWLRDPYTVAIVIDRSASMSGPESEDDAETRRLDAAKRRAVAEVEALGPADRAVVIAAGEEVEVAAPLAQDASVLVPAIESIEPAWGEADLQRSLALASHAVAGRPGPRILVLTDGALDPGATAALRGCVDGPIACEVVASTGPPANVAITAFAARRYPTARDKIEVLAEVRNLGDAPAAVVLDVEAEGVSVGRRELQLSPGQVAREVLGDLDAARARLEARLQAPTDPPPGMSTDLGPAFDDVAYAVVPPLQPLDVALVSDGTNLFLEAALLTLGEHVRLSGVTPEAAREGSAPELAEADLVFFDVGDEPLPAALPEAHTVIFDPWRHEASPCPIAKKADVTRPFLTEQARKHPILDHVVLKDVNIARGTTLVAEPGDTVLVRSLGDPIAVLREGEHSLIAIGFDPRQSDLALRPAFPLLVANIVDYVEQRTPGFVAAVALGQSRDLGLADLGLVPDGVGRVAVAGPEGSGSELPVDRGRFRLRALVPGFYSITAVDGPAAGATVELAVNQASVDASDLHPRFEDAGLADAISEGAAPEPAPIGQGPVWSVLVLLAAVIVAVEWATYHRRVTV